MLWNIISAVAIAYVVIVALLFLFQSRLIYYPQIGREVAITPQAYGLGYESVSIRTEDGETLHAWWVPAPGGEAAARGIILFFHGNAGNISHRLDYLLMFSRLGYATLIVDYRGYGRSSGAPSEQGTYRDALAAWQWLTQTRGAVPQDIVVAGESLGGAVASWLAVNHAPRALLLMSAFTSVPDLAAQIYPFVPARLISRFSYDNLSNIPRIKSPLLIAHSRDDGIVPFAHGQALFAAAAGPREFLEMRGGHNEAFVFTREEWKNAVALFLERYAPGDK
ncbi:MAG: alpha/beta hydrolase [Pseudomonadota bacterium]